MARVRADAGMIRFKPGEGSWQEISIRKTGKSGPAKEKGEAQGLRLESGIRGSEFRN
jgi:hypothetical protein